MSEFRIDPIPNSSADWTSRDGEGRKWNGKAIQTFVRDGIKKAEENSENKIGATYFDEETNTQFQFKTIEDKESWLTSKDASLVLGTDTIRVDSQAVIEDLDEIRSGAALGATALQSIPSEYITEEELSAKGYLTQHQDISGKQDVISDLDAIRSNANLAKTALQSVPSEYITETELSSKSFATQSYVDTKISDLVGSAPEALDTLAELSDALKDNKDIVTVLENSIATKANTSDLDNYALSSHDHDDHYYTESEIDSLLSSKSDSSHTHSQYLTEHQDISHLASKSEIPSLSGYATETFVTTKIAEAKLSGEEVDLTGYATKEDLTNLATKSEIPSLTGYATESWVKEQKYLTEHQDISGKQDKIADLETIRTGAALGASALQSIPTEYVTETELSSKGYLTEHQDISGKQDVITDLATIRANASKGATALQSIPSEYITETELTSMNFAKKADLTGYTTDAEFTALTEIVANKADSSALSDYSQVGHVHDQYLTEHQDVSGKQDIISDLSEIRANALKGSTALQSVPPEYITETELSNKSYATQSYVDTKVSSLVGSAPEALNTLEELSTALKNNKDIVTVLENSIASKANASDLNNYALSSHDHDDLYYTESEINTLLSGKSNSDHTHSQYLTQHQDISGKQDKISDLNTIRQNALKGSTALQSVPDEYITEEELLAKGYITLAEVPKSDVGVSEEWVEQQGFLKEIPEEYAKKSDIPSVSGLASEQWVKDQKYLTEHQDISGKQDKITDLETIRANAAKGASALQSVPSEYITESELNAKGYLTSHQDISGKQDVISDLATIRSNAAKGATALQSVPAEYITETELTAKGYSTVTYVDEKVAALVDGAPDTLDTLDELAAALKNNKDIVTVLENSIASKADKSEIPSLNGYATQTWVENKKYLTEHQSLDGKQDVISDLATIRSGAAKGATALQSVPAEYVTETELTAKGYATTAQVNAKQDKINDLDTIRSGAAAGSTAVQPDSLSAVATGGSYSDLTDKPSIPASVKDLTDGGLYATVSYVDSQVTNVSSGLGGIPQYIYRGADEVVSRVISSRNHASLVIGAMSDLHTAGTDDSATSVKHACMALNEINKLTQLDLVAVLGDVCVDHMDSVNNPGFLYVRQQLDAIDKSVDVIHLEGNHDLDEVNTSADVRRQEYYTYIGANNVDVVTDFGNEFRNYGYKDFDNKRIRVIYLNTSDVAEEGMTTHLRISPEQFTWFVNTALDFSGKTGASDWQVIVLTHIPLNYTNSAISNLLQVLQDYKGKKSGSITQNGTTISYNFTGCQQTFLCHIHGHIHNYRTDWFGDVLSITVPNACFGRNNEYGTSSSYDDTVHELYGDVDKNGNQRTYRKVMATVEDTAFSVFVIDGRVTNKVHVYNYGAGLHRIIDLTTKEIIEEEINYNESEGLTPSGDFVNAVPLSTVVGGVDIYNGVGYKNDIYVSSSTGGDSSRGGYVATGVMAYPVNAVYAHEIFILGADLDTSDNYVRFGLFKEDGTVACLTGTKINEKFTVTKLGEQYYKVEPLYSTEGSGAGTPLIYTSYGSDSPIVGLRISLVGKGNNLYISMKNPIVEGLDGETVNWSAYTNLVPTSEDSNGDVYNGVGYKEGTRLNSSGTEVTLARAICSGFIPYKGEDIRAYGARTEDLTAGAFYVCFYTANHGTVGVIPGREFSGSNPGLTSEMIDERMMLTLIADEVTNTTWAGYIADAAYIRVSMSACSGQVFAVTLDQKLTLS